MLYLVVIYFCFFTYVAFQKFPWAVYLFILSLPTYLIRFSFGPLPSTLLEVSFFALILGWILTVRKTDIEILKKNIVEHRVFSGFIAGALIFSFIGACISMIGAEFPMQKLIYGVGEWRALFLEPILLFLILITRKEKIEENKVVLSLLGAAVFVSVIAVIQKFTGLLFPPSLWDDYLFGRVTSIYTTANAIGLFTVPILFLSVSVVRDKKILVSLAVVLLALANYFSFSQGAWIAIGAGILAYLCVYGYKKISIAITILGIIGCLVMPSMRTAVLFEDRAGQNRIIIWKHTIEYFVASPKNFIFGAGIRNFFDAIQKPFYNPTVLEPLKYPHNILLNFWSEIGLFGMLSFVGIIGYLYYFAFHITDRQKRAACIAALTALIVHGMVDVPYFKNDLSMLFWILAFTILVHYHTTKKSVK